MQIKEVELSPFPQWLSTKSTRLIFSKKEIQALNRAAEIADKARDKLKQYYDMGERDLPRGSYAEAVDLDLAMIGYHVEEITPWENIKLDDFEDMKPLTTSD